MTLFKKGSDGLLNGTIMGALLGVLLASSSIPLIQTAIGFVTNIIPAQYHFAYIEYVVWGLIGGIIGNILDRK